MTYTLEQIARMAGVSRSTVSRIINHQPHVRPEVRQRVEEVIRQVGYQPHAAARSLATNRTQIIGLIIPQAVSTLFTDPYFPHLIRGITEVCNTHHYHLMLSLFSNRAEQKSLYQRVLRSSYLDGVIVSSTVLDDPLIPRLLEDGVPFVYVGRYPDERVNYVDADNVSGARMATEHLLRLGHQRIATVTGPLGMTPGQDRLEGYRQALAARGLSVDDALIVEGDFTEDGGRTATRRLLRHKPTAIFAASDMMAIGVMKAVKDAGMRLPEDVAVIGFDDLPLASMVEPALTTVRQPIDHLGATAVQILLSVLENPGSDGTSVHRVILPTQLVVRASCGSLI